MEEVKNEPTKKSNSERQRAYRNRLKDKLGEKAFKEQQASTMKDYRKRRAEMTTVDETKISNKETRGLVNNLLKTIEERIITMINEQKHSPVPIHFETHIQKDEIEPVLVDINNSMTNEQVVDSFYENDQRNPKSAKGGASRGTFEGYLSAINTIRKKYFGIKKSTRSTVFNDFEWLRDTDRVLEILKSYEKNTKSYSTMVNAISATLGRLNHYHQLYINVYKPLNIKLAKLKDEEQLNTNNLLSEKEKKLFLPWDKILELEDAVKNTNINPIENLAIYYLYTQLPPRRLEYGSLIIQIEGEFENNKKKNYVVLDKKLKTVKKIILNTYKTSEKYGPYVIDNVPEKLSDAIVNLIKEQDYKAGDHLFMNSKGKPYGNSFSSRLKDVFDQAINRPITLNILRHSYITYFINNNTTTLKKKMIANQMGHSTNMQDLYKRFEEKDEEKEED